MNVVPYSHSGQSPAGGLMLSLFATVICSFALGVIYTFLSSWIPVVQLNAIASFACGAAVGAVAGFCARLGKVRNAAVIPFFALLGGGTALWVSWVFDPLARFGKEGVILWDPLQLSGYVGFFYDSGFWSMSKNADPVKGPFLAVIWLAEAVTLVGMSFVVARGIINARPFCEVCDRWTEQLSGFCRVKLDESSPDVVTSVSSGDLSGLPALPGCSGDINGSLRVDLCRCPECTESSYATVFLVTVAVNKKGETTVVSKPVVTMGKLDPGELELLQSLKDRPAS